MLDLTRRISGANRERDQASQKVRDLKREKADLAKRLRAETKAKKRKARSMPNGRDPPNLREVTMEDVLAVTTVGSLDNKHLQRMLEHRGCWSSRRNLATILQKCGFTALGRGLWVRYPNEEDGEMVRRPLDQLA